MPWPPRSVPPAPRSPSCRSRRRGCGRRSRRPPPDRNEKRRRWGWHSLVPLSLLHAGLFDHLGPFGNVALEAFAEFLSRSGIGLQPELQQALLDLRITLDRADLPIELLDDRC